MSRSRPNIFGGGTAGRLRADDAGADGVPKPAPTPVPTALPTKPAPTPVPTETAVIGAQAALRALRVRRRPPRSSALFGAADGAPRAAPPLPRAPRPACPPPLQASARVGPSPPEFRVSFPTMTWAHPDPAGQPHDPPPSGGRPGIFSAPHARVRAPTFDLRRTALRGANAARAARRRRPRRGPVPGSRQWAPSRGPPPAPRGSRSSARRAAGRAARRRAARRAAGRAARRAARPPRPRGRGTRVRGHGEDGGTSREVRRRDERERAHGARGGQLTARLAARADVPCEKEEEAGETRGVCGGAAARILGGRGRGRATARYPS